MRVTVDHDLCIGDGVCEAICPQVFVLRDDGLAYVIEDPVSEDLSSEVEEAMDACPTECIHSHDEDEDIDDRLLESIDA